MSIRSFRITTLLLGVLAMPYGAHAQVLYGSLTGNISDPSGGAVPNAKLEVLNVSTGIAKQAVTDDRGVFLLP
jgi:hypothetical protein